jgi:hypothetical protein
MANLDATMENEVPDVARLLRVGEKHASPVSSPETRERFGTARMTCKSGAVERFYFDTLAVTASNHYARESCCED